MAGPVHIATPLYGRAFRPLAGIGLGQAAQPGGMSAGAYATASVLGASIGGGLTGYIAAHHKDGAITGALFTSGLTSISSAVVYGRERNLVGASVLGIAGLIALGFAFARFQRGLVGAR